MLQNCCTLKEIHFNFCTVQVSSNFSLRELHTERNSLLSYYSDQNKLFWGKKSFVMAVISLTNPFDFILDQSNNHKDKNKFVYHTAEHISKFYRQMSQKGLNVLSMTNLVQH